MPRALRGVLALLILPAVPLIVGGCGSGTNEMRTTETPPGAAETPAAPPSEPSEATPVSNATAKTPSGVAEVPAPAPGEPSEAAPIPDVTEGTATSPSIKEIMTKLTKGPNSLTPVIGDELETENPPWATIQTQTKEFVQLAAAMGKNDPPKGHKSSWEKLTSAYAEWAADLDEAAQAKNKDAALEAHGKLAGSCMACHREHRVMRPGRGGMGGPPGSQRPGMPPGGPPPGGPTPK
jgi:hypothetical protein